MRMTDRLSLV